jgi:LacI family transcriptional regulator
MQLIPQRISLVAQTGDLLKRGIQAGVWKDQLPGEVALCQQLQVSRVTLRAALQQLQREGWCTAGQGRRRRIRHDPSQSHPMPPSDRVVLLSPLALHSLPAGTVYWVDALREHLAAAGYRLEFIESHAAWARHPERVLESLVQEHRAAGWVLYHSNARQQGWFAERGLPCVVSGSSHPGIRIASVDIDYAAACRHAVGCFAAKGRTRLAFLMPRSEQAGNLESERGFLNGIAGHPGLAGEILHHDGSVSGICQTLHRLRRMDPVVDGLLVAKPAHALTALTHLLREGIRLPEQMALISRDDDPMFDHLVPLVARYRTEPAAFARKISRRVVDSVRTGTLRTEASRLTPSFVKGETLG